MQQSQDTPLYTACEEGALQRVQALLLQHADVNAVCSGGNNPIHAAAASGSAAVLAAVTAPALGADLNARNERGMTPLHVIVDSASGYSDRDYAASVDLLLTRGADFTLRNEAGDTALQLAAEYLLDDIIRSFLTHQRKGELTATDLTLAALASTNDAAGVAADAALLAAAAAARAAAAAVAAAAAAVNGSDSSSDSDGESPPPSREGTPGPEPGVQPEPAEHLLVLDIFTQLYTAALSINPAEAEGVLMAALLARAREGDLLPFLVASQALSHSAAQHGELSVREQQQQQRLDAAWEVLGQVEARQREDLQQQREDLQQQLEDLQQQLEALQKQQRQQDQQQLHLVGRERGLEVRAAGLNQLQARLEEQQQDLEQREQQLQQQQPLPQQQQELALPQQQQAEAAAQALQQQPDSSSSQGNPSTALPPAAAAAASGEPSSRYGLQKPRCLTQWSRDCERSLWHSWPQQQPLQSPWKHQPQQQLPQKPFPEQQLPPPQQQRQEQHCPPHQPTTPAGAAKGATHAGARVGEPVLLKGSLSPDSAAVHPQAPFPPSSAAATTTAVDTRPAGAPTTAAVAAAARLAVKAPGVRMAAAAAASGQKASAAASLAEESNCELEGCERSPIPQHRQKRSRS